MHLVTVHKVQSRTVSQSTRVWITLVIKIIPITSHKDHNPTSCSPKGSESHSVTVHVKARIGLTPVSPHESEPQQLTDHNNTRITDPPVTTTGSEPQHNVRTFTNEHKCAPNSVSFSSQLMYHKGEPHWPKPTQHSFTPAIHWHENWNLLPWRGSRCPTGWGMQGPLFLEMAVLLLVLHTGSKAAQGDVTHKKCPDRQACVRRGNGDKAAWGGVTHKISRWASLRQEGQWC